MQRVRNWWRLGRVAVFYLACAGAGAFAVSGLLSGGPAQAGPPAAAGASGRRPVVVPLVHPKGWRTPSNAAHAKLEKAPQHDTKPRRAPAPISPENTASTSSPGRHGKLDLNTANAHDLQKLPGIGPKKALRIVRWRNERGPFRKVRHLRRVKGFGPKTVLRLAPYLSVSARKRRRPQSESPKPTY